MQTELLPDNNGYRATSGPQDLFFILETQIKTFNSININGLSHKKLFLTILSTIQYYQNLLSEFLLTGTSKILNQKIYILFNDTKIFVPTIRICSLLNNIYFEKYETKNLWDSIYETLSSDTILFPYGISQHTKKLKSSSSSTNLSNNIKNINIDINKKVQNIINDVVQEKEPCISDTLNTNDIIQDTTDDDTYNGRDNDIQSIDDDKSDHSTDTSSISYTIPKKIEEVSKDIIIINWQPNHP